MASKWRSEIVKRGLAFVLLAVATILGFHGCEESLPPVVKPSNVLTAELAMDLGTNAFVNMVGGKTPLGTDGAIDVKVTNHYGKVLSDSEMIQVQAEIFQTHHPERRDTIYGTRYNVINTAMLSYKMVTIPPGQELEVLTQWSHSYNDTIPFWTVADADTSVVVAGGIQTLHKVQFTVRAQITVFKRRTAISIGDRVFTVYYRVI